MPRATVRPGRHGVFFGQADGVLPIVSWGRPFLCQTIQTQSDPEFQSQGGACRRDGREDDGGLARDFDADANRIELRPTRSSSGKASF
jgi:hypothetical protein